MFFLALLSRFPRFLTTQAGCDILVPISLCGLGGPIRKMGTSVHGPELGSSILFLPVVVRIVLVVVVVVGACTSTETEM
jgi:hypothetical protein